jgi:hypothetical protein
MSTADKTIRQIMLENNLELPGSDLSKTILFMIFPLVLMVLLTNNPIFSCDVKDLQAYKNASFLVLILCLITTIVSGMSVWSILDCNLGNLSRFFSLFIGKILISLSVFLFFMVICSWVILLGGIMSSPFATILSISPVLLTVQFVQDRKIDFNSIYQAINNEWLSINSNSNLSGKKFTEKIVLFSSFIPILIVLVTLIVGQYYISNHGLHEMLLSNSFSDIISTEWYRHVYFFTYYISVAVAAFGVLPKNVTRRMTYKLF